MVYRLTKSEKLTALIEEFLLGLLMQPLEVDVIIQAEAGQLAGRFARADAVRFISDFLSNLICSLRWPDLYADFGGDSLKPQAELAKYLGDEVGGIALRAWEVYQEELDHRLKEAIESAPMTACLRALCEMEQETGVVVSRDLSLLDDLDKQYRIARLDRWGIRNHRKHGNFETWREFLAVYSQAIEGMKPEQITQENVAGKIKSLGWEKYDTRQFQRDIKKFEEFGLKWKRGRGLVGDDNIQ